jgi:hypothetical protein
MWGCGVCGGVGVSWCGGFVGVGVWGVWWYGWLWWCGGCGGVVVCGGGAVGGGFPMRLNIPRSALCATLDTYNFR